MIAATHAGLTTGYAHNALGQRITKTKADGTGTVYLYDLAGRLVLEASLKGEIQREYFYLGDVPVALVQASAPENLYYIHTDHLNTPRIITDANNAVRWRWDSDPFVVGDNYPDRSYQDS